MNNEIYSCAYENNLICFESKTLEVELKNKESEIKLDVVLEEKQISKIWGRIVDTNHRPIENVIVNLLRPEYIHFKLEYIQVNATLSDSDGFYEFEINEYNKNVNYVVSVERK
ncbi:MAG: hypothetical protein ACRC3Y_17500 [Romboutsia sp.]|uniref:hypothetical protein n=1 Tax=Romboutsia sp. TaxID=1965302 RepID=UPI003F33AF8B